MQIRGGRSTTMTARGQRTILAAVPLAFVKLQSAPSSCTPIIWIVRSLPTSLNHFHFHFREALDAELTITIHKRSTTQLFPCSPTPLDHISMPLSLPICKYIMCRDSHNAGWYPGFGCLSTILCMDLLMYHSWKNSTASRTAVPRPSITIIPTNQLEEKELLMGRSEDKCC